MATVATSPNHRETLADAYAAVTYADLDVCHT
jgi:hypothetical protein